MKVKLIHKEWDDYIILDFNNNTFHREKILNEKGTFVLDDYLLNILWEKWGNESFISYKNDNIYYLCKETNLNNIEWESICYIDYVNNIITRKDNNVKGYINNIDDNELSISWENEDNYTIDYLDKNKDKDIKIEKVIVEEEDKIPNIIHFIYGLKEQLDEFELYRYIAIKSAYEVNRPDKIYFYYYYEPHGYWWDKIKPLLTLEKINIPTEIYNQKLYHYAHQTDIVRLEKLIERGGIYLDIDTICIKSFKKLLKHDFIMAAQSNVDNTEIYGLCNAVILSKPNSFFAIKWLESYVTFRSKGRDEYWDEHSVLKPLELSKIYSDSIIVLDSESFFYPLWYKINDSLFNTNYDTEEYKKIISKSYCIHLWDTYSHKYLKTIDEKFIFDNNTLYNIFCRKFLKNKISIVILTYNRNEITEKCLESYLKCLDNDYIEELIIFDNNSNDQLVDFLVNYQKKNEKIKLILSDENLGVCGGRMILFKEAIGDIIISIDSDAYLIDNSFFDRIMHLLYDETYGIIGISGAFIKSWNFGSQEDIDENDPNEYIVDHIAGCCQSFRRDLSLFGFELDPYYGKFWVEDTDLSMQSLYLNKLNYKINQSKYIEHHWGGSGKDYKDLFISNWNYFSNKWKGKVLHHIR